MSIPFKVSNQTEYTRREEVCNPEINCTHPKLVLHSANSEISLKIKKNKHTYILLPFLEALCLTSWGLLIYIPCKPNTHTQLLFMYTCNMHSHHHSLATYAPAPTIPINAIGAPTALRKIRSTSFASFIASAVVAVFFMWNTDEKEHCNARFWSTLWATDADADGDDMCLITE